MNQKVKLVFETSTGIVEWEVEHVVFLQVKSKLLRGDKFINIAGTMYNTDHIISVKVEEGPLYLKNQ